MGKLEDQRAMGTEYKSLEQMAARGYSIQEAAKRLAEDQKQYAELVEYGQTFLDDPENGSLDEKDTGCSGHGRIPVIIDGVEYASVTDAARVLGIPRTTLYSRVKAGRVEKRYV